MGTLLYRACPGTSVRNDEIYDAWPVDFDDNQKVDILDIVQLTPPVFGSSPPNPNYSQRKDLDANGTINILDIVRLTPPMFQRTCTSVPPPIKASFRTGGTSA